MVEFSPTIYGMYTVEKLGTGTQEIYNKEFNKIVEFIKNKNQALIDKIDKKIEKIQNKEKEELLNKKIEESK